MHLLMHCHLHLQLTRLHFLLHHKNIYLDPQLSRKTGRLDVQVHPSFAGSTARLRIMLQAFGAASMTSIAFCLVSQC